MLGGAVELGSAAAFMDALDLDHMSSKFQRQGENLRRNRETRSTAVRYGISWHNRILEDIVGRRSGTVPEDDGGSTNLIRRN